MMVLQISNHDALFEIFMMCETLLISNCVIGEKVTALEFLNKGYAMLLYLKTHNTISCV